MHETIIWQFSTHERIHYGRSLTFRRAIKDHRAQILVNRPLKGEVNPFCFCSFSHEAKRRTPPLCSRATRPCEQQRDRFTIYNYARDESSPTFRSRKITRIIRRDAWSLSQSMFFSDLHVPARVRPCQQSTMLFPHCKFTAQVSLTMLPMLERIIFFFSHAPRREYTERPRNRSNYFQVTVSLPSRNGTLRLVYVCHRSTNIQEFYPNVTSLPQLATERIKWRHLSKEEKRRRKSWRNVFFSKDKISLSRTWSSSDGKCDISIPLSLIFLS